MQNSPKEAVQMYNKGIQVLEKDISIYKLTGMKEELDLAVKQSSAAYASIAELYMASELWYTIKLLYKYYFIVINQMQKRNLKSALKKHYQ